MRFFSESGIFSKNDGTKPKYTAFDFSHYHSTNKRQYSILNMQVAL